MAWAQLRYIEQSLRIQELFFSPLCLFCSLSDCSFTADGCQELANALRHNHNMKILDIRNNDVQDNGVKHLCEVLQDPNCELNTLG